MTIWLSNIAAITIFIGACFVAIGCLGIYRMPDFYCRGHALAVGSLLGSSLILLGAAAFLWPHDRTASLKLGLALCFQLLTIPLSSHILARVAYFKKLPCWKDKETNGEPK